MRINQIFLDVEDLDLELRTLKAQCSEFLKESQGLPVYKLLPTVYSDFQKVKVRKHKRDNDFISTFNEAFQDEVRDLRQRAVFASGEFPDAEAGKASCYIFPKNGYKYMYCTEVTHSTSDYKTVFESIFQNVDTPEEVIHDLLKFSYARENLFEGIQSRAELIFYHIPYYYAIKTESYDYEDLLTDIAEMEDIS